jgi:catechol 2,3-dioxygenase-like lactoylglutathione lyase family enzyme
MLYESIDHVILAVPSLSDAAAPFERLGLTLTPEARHRRRGTANRAFFVGGPESEFYVELLAIADRDEARRARGEAFVQATDAGPRLIAVMLRVSDIAAALDDLARRGVRASAVEVVADDGRTICDVAELGVAEQAGVDLRLVQYPEPPADRHARHERAGLFGHALPLKRLDHLAVIAPNLEEATRFWVEVLAVPVFGEVRPPGTPPRVIRQMKIGDAIVELIGPATLDGTMAGRPAGLASMCAFEVADAAAAVAAARAAGFTVPDPAPGPLPGTRTATIPAAEMSGMGLQLLEYV